MRLPVLRRQGRAPSTESVGASLTSNWFDQLALERIANRYARYPTTDLSYATVRDYVDSFETLNPLTVAQGDLKDVQRPWALKTILGTVSPGARVMEVGGGQPYVADILARLGYDVWLIDPYDGSGNGPIEYEAYRRACPAVHFVRSRFDDTLDDAPAGSVACVFSISVLEHVDTDGLRGIFRGMVRFLKPDGVSVHAIDHVHKGRGDSEHLAKLRFIVAALGLSVSKLDRVLSEIDEDTETYFLSAESHNRWRGALPYDDFPMRVCVSIQTVSGAEALVAEALE
jgi:2-polyprenyl-3-methyl-5-hydroxy-6-metoxy-1,4-benzoquinol methylase